MNVIKVERNSGLWKYLSQYQKSLIADGEAVLADVAHFAGVSDFSFAVFPFAKAYEGFLKQLFLDLGLIKEQDYFGDDIRIGRILNPHYRDKDSVYESLAESKRAGRQLAGLLWDIWKKGRNQVFHYYPHNLKKLSYDEAVLLVSEILAAMETAIGSLQAV